MAARVYQFLIEKLKGEWTSAKKRSEKRKLRQMSSELGEGKHFDWQTDEEKKYLQSWSVERQQHVHF